MINQKKDASPSQSVARNALWNLSGMVIPVIVAIFSIPLLLKGLGESRFGLLSIAWVVLGYFSFFDFGLGRTTTKFVAEYIQAGKLAELPGMIWNSLIAHLALGITGGAILALLSGLLVDRFLSIPAELLSETRQTFYLLAASVPVIVVTSAVRGILEATHRFDIVNFVKIPASMINYLGPILVLLFTDNLMVIVLVIAISRAIVLGVYLGYCIAMYPTLRAPFQFDSSLIKSMLGFGGWLTISNLINPTIASLDRFMIGSLISLSAVSYYVVSYEIVTKLWILSAGLLGVLFPIFTTTGLDHLDQLNTLYWRAVNLLLAVTATIVGILLLSSYDIISLWIDSSFAQESAPVMRWLAVGTLFSVIAQVPYTLLQATGKAAIVAKLQLIELPIYAIALWLIAEPMGLSGIALIWAIRAIIDAILMFGAVQILIPQDTASKYTIVRKVFFTVLFLFLFWISGSYSQLPMHLKMIETIFLSALFGIWSWFYLLEKADRIMLRKIIAGCLKVK